jgi:hypothetical protein
MAMLCPNDGTVLTIADRQGVEIDFCPECRGVWLDRGELDKIIDRGAKYADRSDDRDVRREPRAYEPDDRARPSYGTHSKKKRKGFLEEIFDF